MAFTDSRLFILSDTLPTCRCTATRRATTRRSRRWRRTSARTCSARRSTTCPGHGASTRRKSRCARSRRRSGTRSGSGRRRNGAAWRSSGRRTRRRCCRSAKSTWRRQRGRSCLPKRSGRRRSAAVGSGTTTCPTRVAVGTRAAPVVEEGTPRTRASRSGGRRRRAAARRRAAGSDARNRIVAATRTVTTRRVRRRRSGARRRTAPRRRRRLTGCRRSKRAGSCPRRRFRRASRRVTRTGGTRAVAVSRRAVERAAVVEGRGESLRAAMARVRREAAAGRAVDRGVCRGLGPAPDLGRGPGQGRAAAVARWPVGDRERVAAGAGLGRGGAGVARRSVVARGEVAANRRPAEGLAGVVRGRGAAGVGQRIPAAAAVGRRRAVAPGEADPHRRAIEIDKNYILIHIEIEGVVTRMRFLCKYRDLKSPKCLSFVDVLFPLSHSLSLCWANAPLSCVDVCERDKQVCGVRTICSTELTSHHTSLVASGQWTCRRLLFQNFSPANRQKNGLPVSNYNLESDDHTSISNVSCGATGKQTLP